MKSDIPSWCTDEECSNCDGTGKRADGMYYCSICNGRKYLHKPSKPDDWFLVNDREGLWTKWLEYTEEPGSYDTFIEPIEFPCVARFFSASEADVGGKFVQYFYRRNLPLSWSDNGLAGIGV